MTTSPRAQRIGSVDRPHRMRRRWFALLFTMLVFIGGVLFFWGPYARVEMIRIRGAQYVDEHSIKKQARLGVGQVYWLVRPEVIQGRLMQLPTVARVDVQKRFPAQIAIAMTEYPVVAIELIGDTTHAQQRTQASTTRMKGVLSNGVHVSLDTIPNVLDWPLLSGWTDPEQRRILCRLLADITPETLDDVSEIRPYASPTYPDRIKLYTRSRYEVVTRLSLLAQKIPLLSSYVYALQSEDRTDGTIVLLETNYWEPPRSEGIPVPPNAVNTQTE